jgi:RNA polymerase sigma factor (sigma-70 family)
MEDNILERIKKGGEDSQKALTELKNTIGNFIIVVFSKKGFVYDKDYTEQDVSDFTEDIIVKVYQGINNFKGESKLSTWLYTIVENYCYDVMEERIKKKKFVKEEIPLGEELENEEGERAVKEVSDPKCSNIPAIASVNLILEKLKPEHKKILEMNFDKIDTKEIMKELNLKKTKYYKELREARAEFEAKAKSLGIDTKELRRELPKRKPPTIGFVIIIFIMLVFTSLLIQPKVKEKIFYPTKPIYLKHEIKKENKILKWIKRQLDKFKKEPKENNWQTK